VHDSRPYTAQSNFRQVGFEGKAVAADGDAAALDRPQRGDRGNA
jgi:hypothetical protein